MSDEKIYFEGLGVRITNTWLAFGKRVYRTQNVTSVSTRMVKADRTVWVTRVALVMFLVFLIGFSLNISDVYFPFFSYVEATCVVIGFVLLIFLLIMEIRNRNATPRDEIYLIGLQGSFGKSTAYASLDSEHVEQITRGIEEALHRKTTLEQTALSSDEEETYPEWTEEQEVPDHAVAVRQDGVRIGTKIYPLSSIKSARVWSVQVSKVDDVLDGMFLLGWLTWAVSGLLPYNVGRRPDDPYRWLRELLDIGRFVLVFTPIVYRYYRPRIKAYLVQLHGTFGHISAFVTLNEAYAQKIIKTINDTVRTDTNRNLLKSSAD